MHASEIASSCHILLISVRGGGGGGGGGGTEEFYWRGRKFPRKSTLGGGFFLRIFSPPEKISGGRFCPVTPVQYFTTSNRVAVSHGVLCPITNVFCSVAYERLSKANEHYYDHNSTTESSELATDYHAVRILT